MSTAVNDDTVDASSNNGLDGQKDVENPSLDSDQLQSSKHKSRHWYDCDARQARKIAPHHKLMSDERVRKWSMGVLRFGIFADSVTNAILQPNYPFMARAGANEESFPNTNPFDFNSATYFIPMSALIGVAIASSIAGPLSDKIGRKPVLQVCMGGSVFGNMLKWFLRGSFWGFCGGSFVNGLLSGGLPVALAYLGDVFVDVRKKESEFGILVGFFVLGNASGGIVAILMADQGLFAPLWVAAALMAVAFMLITQYLVEPKELMLLGKNKLTESALLLEEEAMEDIPTTIDRKVMYNIVVGAFADNVGSNALFPLCLSPLAFNHWITDFTDVGQEPVLSFDGFKWLSVLVALMVIPSTVITPPVFKRIGAAGGCVLGNFITGIVTIILLMLGTQDPTSGYLAGFIATMYIGFPFTVISQLSTGPMLDRIAPIEKRGYVQGLNTTVMNVGTAVAPWALGLLADASGAEVAIWTGIGISFLAAVINFPLVYQPGMGPPPKKKHEELHAMDWEDEEVVQRVLNGEYIPGAVLDKINDERAKQGLPFLLPAVGTFADDKDSLVAIQKDAMEDFKSIIRRNHYYLEEIAKNREAGSLEHELKNLNRAITLDSEQQDQSHQDLGMWFAQYLQHAGYYPHTNPALCKHMIVSAFPVLMEDRRFTEENVEQYLVNAELIYSKYIEISEESTKYDLSNLVRGQHAPLGFRTFWS